MKLSGHLIVLSIVVCSNVAAMFSRKAREEHSGDAQRRFRANLESLFLANTVSANRIQSVAEDAQAAGAGGVKKIAHIKGKHMHRDLLRRLSKGNKWPPLYKAPIRVWDAKKQVQTIIQLPVLLPHEVLDAFAKNNVVEQLYDVQALGGTSLEHIRKVKSDLSISDAVALGFWLDGVPCNWDRSESIECLTMSLPGLGGKNRAIRVPLAVLPKRFQIDKETSDDILNVMSWSLMHSAAGVWPSVRHDGSAFNQSVGDPWRGAKARGPLLVIW